MLELNPRSSVPLYTQLAERLLASIRAGEYPSGEAIPSENELSRVYDIGRPTVRQATESLVRRGLLERRRGSGTFVREGAESIDLFSLGGTLASFSSKGVTLTTRILRRPRLVTVAQEHALSGRQVFFFSRLGSVQRRPVLLERFWFDAEVFPEFDALSWSGGSLSEAVRSRYRLEPLSADQSFEAVLPDCEEAKLLAVEEGQPLLKVQRVLHFATAREAVASEILCRSDRFVMSQTIGGAFG